MLSKSEGSGQGYIQYVSQVDMVRITFSEGCIQSVEGGQGYIQSVSQGEMVRVTFSQFWGKEAVSHIHQVVTVILHECHLFWG